MSYEATSKEPITMKRIVLLIVMMMTCGFCWCPDGVDDIYEGYNALSPAKLLQRTGSYHAYTVLTYENSYRGDVISNREPLKERDGYLYPTWAKIDDWKYYDVKCKLIKQGYEYGEDAYDYLRNKRCIINFLECTVTEIPQFYWYNGKEFIDIYYYTLRGNRSNGTLAWIRTYNGAPDYYCFDKSGMNIIKRVNDPKACK